jgi:hypothetical protein
MASRLAKFKKNTLRRRRVSRKVSRKARSRRQRGGATGARDPIIVYGIIDPANLSIANMSSPTAGVTATGGTATCTINFPSPMKITNMTYSTYKSAPSCTAWCAEKQYNKTGSERALSLSSSGRGLLARTVPGQAARVLGSEAVTSITVDKFTTTNLGGATTLKKTTLDTTVNTPTGANFRITFTIA